MIDAWGIAIHEDNIYLTDSGSHSISYFKIDPVGIHLIAKRGSKGKSVGELSYPKQLAISTDEEIFIADEWNNRIQILNNDLHYLRQIWHDSIEFPHDVKLTAEEVRICAL